ncbi:MAG: alpha/beta fold hydrolase, partial [Pseudomonadota bacterium]
MSKANPIVNKLLSSVAVLALMLSVSIHAGATSTQVANAGAASVATSVQQVQQTRHKTLIVNGVEVFYREAGPSDAPTILLLHGFPTSSHMFRNLIPALAYKYHVVAPDYPGFGNSEQPAMDQFDYSFDNLATLVESFVDQLGIDRYSLYLMDYGAPIGFRLAAKHPERVQSLIVQN